MMDSAKRERVAVLTGGIAGLLVALFLTYALPYPAEEVPRWGDVLTGWAFCFSGILLALTIDRIFS